MTCFTCQHSVAYWSRSWLLLAVLHIVMTSVCTYLSQLSYFALVPKSHACDVLGIQT